MFTGRRPNFANDVFFGFDFCQPEVWRLRYAEAQLLPISMRNTLFVTEGCEGCDVKVSSFINIRYMYTKVADRHCLLGWVVLGLWVP